LFNLIFKDAQLLFEVSLFGLFKLCKVALELVFDLAFLLFKFSCVFASDIVNF
jgi:hypothetical protein